MKESQVRALIVDDIPIRRNRLSTVLSSSDEITVVGSARDGHDAIARLRACRPDVVTLDLQMPRMNGFSLLRWIMKNSPMPVVVVSALSDTETVFRALELGAVDFVPFPDLLPSTYSRKVADDLINKVLVAAKLPATRIAARARRVRRRLRELESEATGEDQAIAAEPRARRQDRDQQSSRGCATSVLLLAASTGGPPAIRGLLAELPADIECSIVVAQHMPAGFTRSFAERLNKSCQLTVDEARGGERLQPGYAYVAPGGRHTTLWTDKQNNHRLQVAKIGAGDHYVPSIDKLLASAANVYAHRALAIVLTGMGRDGVEGARAIRQAGGAVVVEDESTAVVFGMPGEILGQGLANESLPLDDIPERIRTAFKLRAHRRPINDRS